MVGGRGSSSGGSRGVPCACGDELLILLSLSSDHLRHRGRGRDGEKIDNDTKGQ